MIKKDFEFTEAKRLREKAEEKLKQSQRTTTLAIEADVKRLLHELQVHQIELEMQNEELRRANELTESALRKYTLLYDFAPMGYFTLDQNGLIADLNFTGAELLGDKRFSLLNTQFRLFINAETLPTFDRFFKEVFNTKAKESCQVMLGYDKKALCPVYVEGIVTGDDKQCLLSVLNISGFKKA